MWQISFNQIIWNDGLLTYDGDPYDIYMAVNKEGKLRFGLKCLEYFCQRGCPYEDIVILYACLRDEDLGTLSRKLYQNLHHPLLLCKDIISENKK